MQWLSCRAAQAVCSIAGRVCWAVHSWMSLLAMYLSTARKASSPWHCRSCSSEAADLCPGLSGADPPCSGPSVLTGCSCSAMRKPKHVSPEAAQGHHPQDTRHPTCFSAFPSQSELMGTAANSSQHSRGPPGISPTALEEDDSCLRAQSGPGNMGGCIFIAN